MEARDLPLLAELEPEHLAVILELARTVTLPGGALVFAEGEPGDALYLILEGRVTALREIDAEKGRKMVISTFGPGAFFGEMALLDGDPRSTSVVAATDLRLLRLERDSFRRLLEENGTVGHRLLLALVREMSLRMRETNLQLISLFEAGNLLAGSRSLDELCRSFLQRLLMATRTSAGLIVTRNSATGAPEARASIGYEQPVDVARRGSVIDLVLATGRELQVEDIGADPRTRDATPCGCERVSLLLLPLRRQEQVSGVIVLTSEQPRAFSDRDTVLAGAMAAVLGTAVENTTLYREQADRERLGRRFVSF